jgi:hypothetical protein
MKFFLNSLLVIFLGLPINSQGVIRNEKSRYYEMRDKTIIDRSLKRQEFSSYFEFDLSSSSGMYDLFTDIKSSTSGDKTSAQKTQAVAEVLNKQINVERYFDFDIAIAIPLPEAQLMGKKTLINLFATANVGAMQSFENQNNVLNSTSQVYLKIEYKIGLSSKHFYSEKELIRFNLYQILRKDVYSNLNYAQIAGNGKLFNTDSISNSHKFYAIDLAYEKNFGKSAYLLEAKEFSIYKQSDTKSFYGDNPLLHAQVSRPIQNNQMLGPFAGLHYRKAYDLGSGLYLGTKIKYSPELPFVLIAKLSNTFLTLTQNVELKWLQLSYSFDTAWRNPQNDLWVPPLHSIYVSIPI